MDFIIVDFGITCFFLVCFNKYPQVKAIGYDRCNMQYLICIIKYITHNMLRNGFLGLLHLLCKFSQLLHR